jgi:hypothetical protein
MSETSRHQRSISVADAQAAVVLDALITTYAVKADALATAAGTAPPEVVQDARRELAEAEDALDAIGWAAGPGGFELAGPAGLVREVLYAALFAVIEGCGERCREYEAGRVGREALAAAVADVDAVHALFSALEAADAL